MPLRIQNLLAATTVALSLSACAHYTVQTPEPNPAGQTHSVTMTAYFWGAIDQEHYAHLCDVSNSLDMVRVQDNLGYDILSVITLGIVKPMKIEYRCSAGASVEGPTIGE